MKLTLLIVVVALLGSVVAYLAMDHQEKTVSQQRNMSFDAKYLK